MQAAMTACANEKSSIAGFMASIVAAGGARSAEQTL